MTLKARRWGLILLAAAATLGPLTASAQAENNAVTTGPATYITSTTAVLTGTIQTEGQPTYWQFEYGRHSQYGTTTMARLIPAGHGTVNVSVRIRDLARRTKYHFRLFMQYGQGTEYYPIFLNFGSDRTFSTSGASLGLGSSTLQLSGRLAPVSLYCAGRATCRAKLRITHAAAGHGAQTLAQRSITLPAGQTRTFSAKLSSLAVSLLKHNADKLGASLTVSPGNGSTPLRAHVTLVGL